MRFQLPRAHILSATSEREVERILFDAIGQIDPEELRVLPEEALPVLANLHADIQESAVTLLHCDLRHRGDATAASELLRQVAELYAWASVRISQIRHRTIPAQ